MGNLGAEKAKNQGLGWQQGCGGGALVKAPEEKWGKMGKAPEEKWGKMGENGGKWGKMGGNGEEMGRKWGERGPVAPPKFPYFPPFSPIFPHFPPIFPHFPPFSPISPHFPPFFLAMGTLWVRLWVQYPPPEPGPSEPCRGMPPQTTTKCIELPTGNPLTFMVSPVGGLGHFWVVDFSKLWVDLPTCC